MTFGLPLIFLNKHSWKAVGWQRVSMVGCAGFCKEEEETKSKVRCMGRRSGSMVSHVVIKSVTKD